MPDGPRGFLLMLRRTFDSEPLGFFADREAAEAEARSMLEGYDPRAPAKGQPERGRGELGPPGVVSRVIGLEVIPFVDGRPSASGRSRFTPEWSLPSGRKPRKKDRTS
jgi:hypothetical protein